MRSGENRALVTVTPESCVKGNVHISHIPPPTYTHTYTVLFRLGSRQMVRFFGSSLGFLSEVVALKDNSPVITNLPLNSGAAREF